MERPPNGKKTRCGRRMRATSADFSPHIIRFPALAALARRPRERWMGMRRTDQRWRTARRCACLDTEVCCQREFIAELVRAHHESIALVRTLLLSRDRDDSFRVGADHAAAVAADNPADRRANEWAIEAAALAGAAHVAQLHATDEWASHVMHVHGLMAMADELYGDRVPAGPAAPAPTAMSLPRSRSRGDCDGWAGQPPRRCAE
jgi:hypothetical protein